MCGWEKGPDIYNNIIKGVPLLYDWIMCACVCECGENHLSKIARHIYISWIQFECTKFLVGNYISDYLLLYM